MTKTNDFILFSIKREYHASGKLKSISSTITLLPTGLSKWGRVDVQHLATVLFLLNVIV